MATSQEVLTLGNYLYLRGRILYGMTSEKDVEILDKLFWGVDKMSEKFSNRLQQILADMNELVADDTTLDTAIQDLYEELSDLYDELVAEGL